MRVYEQPEEPAAKEIATPYGVAILTVNLQRNYLNVTYVGMVKADVSLSQS